MKIWQSCIDDIAKTENKLLETKSTNFTIYSCSVMSGHCTKLIITSQTQRRLQYNLFCLTLDSFSLPQKDTHLRSDSDMTPTLLLQIGE